MMTLRCGARSPLKRSDFVREELLGGRSFSSDMPNHLHLLLTPGNGTSLEKAMQLIKGGSSHEIHQQRGHKMQIWQPGFHESTMRDTDDFQARRRYVHNNPVVAHLVHEPAEWLYSSASGRFALNPAPETLSSGAKACSLVANMSELKLRPPEKSPHQSARHHPSGAGGGE